MDVKKKRPLRETTTMNIIFQVGLTEFARTCQAMPLNPQEQETIVEERGKAVSRPYRTVLTFCCLISRNFLMLYLFSLKSKNLSMIGGQMLFTTLYTSLVKV